MRFSHAQWRRTSIQVLSVCLVVFSVVSVAMSQAQSNAADLQGVVRDANGAVVPNATVSARSTARNQTRETTTNEDGFYKIINLPPGEYEVTVTSTGYKTAVIKVTITVGQTATQDIPLEVGDIKAVVNVTAGFKPNIVETNNTAVANNVDQH